MEAKDEADVHREVHRALSARRDGVRKMENVGDPRLIVCTNADTDSGSTGMSDWTKKNQQLHWSGQKGNN